MRSASTARSLPRRRENGAPARWDQYRELLARHRVPHQAQRWYIAHVENLLRDLQPDSLSRLTAPQVTDYFQRVSARGHLQDWQFRQLVDVTQLLLVELAQASCAST